MIKKLLLLPLLLPIFTGCRTTSPPAQQAAQLVNPEAPPPPEVQKVQSEIAFEMIGDDWRVVDISGDHAHYLLAALAGEETLDNWTELIEIQVSLNVPLTSMEQAWAAVQKSLTASENPNDSNLIAMTENKMSYELVSSASGGVVSERSVHTWMKGDDGLYMVIFSVKENAYKLDRFERWKTRIMEAYLKPVGS